MWVTLLYQQQVMSPALAAGYLQHIMRASLRSAFQNSAVETAPRETKQNILFIWKKQNKIFCLCEKQNQAFCLCEKIKVFICHWVKGRCPWTSCLVPCKDESILMEPRWWGFFLTGRHSSPKSHQILLGCSPCDSLVSEFCCFPVLGVLPLKGCSAVPQFLIKTGELLLIRIKTVHRCSLCFPKNIWRICCSCVSQWNVFSIKTFEPADMHVYNLCVCLYLYIYTHTHMNIQCFIALFWDFCFHEQDRP